MNGLPRDLDLSPMQATVIQLCFGTAQLQVHFDNSSQLAVEGACIMREADGSEILIRDFAGSATALCRLLGERTRSAERTESGGLLLGFVNGNYFEVLCDSREYESFQLVLRGTTFIA